MVRNDPDTYKQALQKAQAELANAIRQRDHWTLEIARLQQLVRSLAAMVVKSNQAEAAAELVGLQELVLSCVRSSEAEMSPIDVRQKLAFYGYDLQKYRNPLAVIHGALKRLQDAGMLWEARGKYRAVPIVHPPNTEEEGPLFLRRRKKL